MFGISPGEFLLILVIAIAVIPAKNWPDVARAAARAVKFVRELVWKITDAAEDIKEQIDLEKPITELTQKTMDDVMSAFASPKKSKPKKRAAKKK
jgi:Sec-independent protein translocase protein TatA